MNHAVITSAVRTPLGSFGGTLSDIGAQVACGIDMKYVRMSPIYAILKVLNLNLEKVNVNGDSVALGHSIGASSARVLMTLIYEMLKQDVKTGLAALCIGSGEAVALIIRQ
ncbi:MAG: hypothetical protein CSA29_01940 [Desulfobacterales bacterium]|nr:MAG: hypothetical protein CSA29_01940 [Desulfobacterales bacterium]